MTKRQYQPAHYPRHYNPMPDPDIYIPRTEHIEKLLERDKEMIILAKAAVDKQMEGVPGLYLKVESYESRHKEITDKIEIINSSIATFVTRKEFEPLSKQVIGLATNQAATWKYISFFFSMAGLALLLHKLWGNP
jgi:hypothetical protein